MQKLCKRNLKILMGHWVLPAALGIDRKRALKYPHIMFILISCLECRLALVCSYSVFPLLGCIPHHKEYINPIFENRRGKKSPVSKAIYAEPCSLTLNRKSWNKELSLERKGRKTAENFETMLISVKNEWWLVTFTNVLRGALLNGIK